MTTFLNKLKPIFLLVSFGIFSVFVSFLFKSDQVNSQDIKEISVEENAQEDSSNSEGVTAKEVSEVGQVVLASKTATGGDLCGQLIPKIESISKCELSGSGDVDYNEANAHGTYVSKDSTVYLSEINVPVTLLSASEVKDSNRENTVVTPIFKSGGEQFTVNDGNIYVAPGTSVTDVEGVSWTENKSFGTKYSLGFAETFSTPNETGYVGINKKKSNYCEDVGNPSNPNPSKSNALATYLINTTRYPGEIETIGSKITGESCQNVTLKENIDDNYQSCKMTLTEKIKTTITAAITDAQFDHCHETKYDDEGNPVGDYSEECIKAEDIIVVISSMFGADEDCPDGYCTNTYMTKRNKSEMDPATASSYNEKVYYLTDCKAIIEGEFGEINIKCAWDFSYLYKEKTVAEYNNTPGEGNVSVDMYNKYLKQEVIDRKNRPLIDLL